MKNMFKKLNWVQWLSIAIFIILTVFLITYCCYSSVAFNNTNALVHDLNNGFYGDLNWEQSSRLSSTQFQNTNIIFSYLFVIIALYVILTAFLALVFIREFKKNKEKV